MSSESKRVYLYAITDNMGNHLPVKAGLDDGPLYNLMHQDIAGVIGTVAMSEIRPTPDNIWTHERVVEQLMDDRAVLPVRFGTLFRGQHAIRTALATHYSAFSAKLDRVRGCVELKLRVMWDDDKARKETQESGTVDLCDQAAAWLETEAQSMKKEGLRYLLTRFNEQCADRALRDRANSLANRLHEPLAQEAVEETYQILVTPRLVLSAAYLVERDHVARMKHLVQNLQQQNEHLRFLLTGPWPVYDFVVMDISMENMGEDGNASMCE